jgi:hypothetical protein
MMIHAPADRKAKRLSLEEWLARYDATDLLPLLAKRQEMLPARMAIPADRIVVRT